MSQTYLDGRWYVAGFRDARYARAGLGEYRFEQLGEYCEQTGRFHDEDGGQDWAPGDADVWILQGEKEEETTEVDVQVARVLRRRAARMTREELEAIEDDDDHPMSQEAREELDARDAERGGAGGPFDEPEDTPALDPPWWSMP